MPNYIKNLRKKSGLFSRSSDRPGQGQQPPPATPQPAHSREGQASSSSKDSGSVDKIKLLERVDEFVSGNPELFSGPLESVNDDQALEDSLNGFKANAKLMIQGLELLGQLHPFVGTAVGAFTLVVNMELTRRDNDNKIIALQLQMLNLLTVFFELRRVHNSQEKDRGGTSIADRLEGLMRQVTSDIKACGSACDEYKKKGVLVRIMTANGYEVRFAGIAQKFAQHRSDLQLSLSLHTALSVDAANDKLDRQGQMLKDINSKMMMMFSQCNTPRERELQKLIEERGGVTACINNDEYLEELVAKSGDSLSRISGRSAASDRRSNDLPEIRRRLTKEIQEDIDEAFKRNMVLFERKLDMQNRQLNETLRQESGHIISALMAGAHDRINDPNLRKLWKDMGWKGSVKARTFVLHLHDYYADKPDAASGPHAVNKGSLSNSVASLPLTRVDSIPLSRGKPDDRWALSYINAAYVQSILEAVDDDGTGFISIKEVNTFVEERPAGWSLPEWFAYWAAGWQISITQYKSKIYGLVRSMFEMLDHILPSNRRGVDQYLFHPSFWRIELILRSTRSVNPHMLSDSDLVRHTEMYAASEENRLEMSLEKIRYELDTTATVSLVTGEGRIERFAYPLIYLLLKRHLRVLTLACKHVLDAEEFIALNESLVSVLLMIDTRIQNLEAVFKQTHFDIQARLGNFAFGLLQLSYGDIRRVPAQITFGTWGQADDVTPCPREPVTKETIQATLSNTSYEILKYGHRDGYQSTDYFEFEPQRRRHLGPAHPLEGTWTGHNLVMAGEDTITYVLRISILVQHGQQIVGKGEHFTSAFEFAGRVHLDPGRRSKYGVSFALTDDKDSLQKECHGELDSETGILRAQWRDRRTDEDPSNIAYQSFELTQTPPSLTRYRYTNEAFTEDRVRARWGFACAAARHMAQEKMWSRGFLEERATERKRYVELSTRSLIVTMRLTPQKPLSAAERGELDWLRRNLNPSEARFYQALADFEIQKLPWHPVWGCDWCERRITKARHLCITCMSEDLSDNIDLCSACVDRAPSKRGFVHDPSHIMVKVEETLHDFHFIRVVENAKVTVEKMKNLFRVLEANALHLEEGVDTEGEDRHKVVCAYCAKKLSMPPSCWACIICPRDTFICNGCDTNRVPPFESSLSPCHKPSHPLVRIKGTSLSGKLVSVEERLNNLEQRLIALEHKVVNGFATANSMFENRNVELESCVKDRLAKLETFTAGKFDTIEVVLGQLTSQITALHAIYRQAVGDTEEGSSIPPNLYQTL